MAQKRRKSGDDDPQHLPSKRVTRSGGKTSTEQVTKEPIATQSRAHPTRAVKTKKEKTTVAKPSSKDEPKKKPSKTQPKAAPATTRQSNTIETFTISSSLTKKPFQAQIYKASKQNARGTTLIFTHGAGGTISAPAVVNFCTGFANTLSVLAFQGSTHLASRAKSFEACLEYLQDQGQTKKKQASKATQFVLGGRSMGARAAVMAATTLISEAKGTTPKLKLILVSYPLKGPKNDIRDQILLDLPESVHVLFIVGDKDAMCPVDMLENVRNKMKARNELLIAVGADHGMHVKVDGGDKKTGEKSGAHAADWVVNDGCPEAGMNQAD